MAFYAEEGEAWKCPKHPSKHRRTGVCPVCLRDRLLALCPDCANLRPCACCSTATTTTTASSSSSSSSSFSMFSSSVDASKPAGVGTVGRVSNLIEAEPAFRKSRSVAIPFLRSRFAADTDAGNLRPAPTESRSKSSFWSVFRSPRKSKKCDVGRVEEELNNREVDDEDAKFLRTMMRSRSVSAQAPRIPIAGDCRSSSAKGRGWHFPSPINVFRHSKNSKIVQERSPLYRG